METVQDGEALKEALEQASNDRGEPHWVTERRLAAIDHMASLPLPKIPNFDFQDWPLMPTDRPLGRVRSGRALAPDVKVEAEDVQMTQVGQTTIATNLPDDLFDQGVILTDIFSAFREHPRLTQRYFMGKVIKSDEDRLTSYHTAFLNSGVFLFVPKGVVIDQPIEVHLIQDSTQRAPLVSHVLIIAEENSQFSFNQHLTTNGSEANLASCVVEILARPNSRIDFSSLDELGQYTTAYLNRRAFISRGAKVNWTTGLMNSGNTVGQFSSELVGDEAAVDTKLMAIAAAKQHIGVDTSVTTRGQNTTSHVQQRGGLREDSQLVLSENGQVDSTQISHLEDQLKNQETRQHQIVQTLFGKILNSTTSKSLRQEMTNAIERKLKRG